MARTKRSNPGAGDAEAGRILCDLEQRETPRNGYRAARRDAPVNCPSCGREVQRRARQQRFCSRCCRQKANYGEKVARGDFSTLTIARPTNPPKKDNKFKALQRQKRSRATACATLAMSRGRTLPSNTDPRRTTSID